MRNNYSINVKKSDFLEALRVVYEDASINYLIALRDGLNILISSRCNNSIDFTKYKGLVTI